MSSPTVDALVEALRTLQLLEPAELEEVASRLRPRSPGAEALLSELVTRGWLTAFQAGRLAQGRGAELVLGPYVLLGQLGAGGMGQVYKALSRKLGRVVALKRIREDRLTEPDVVRRFRREVQAAAALDHPNIVHALDADEVGGTRVLVMEYVEGATDLARLVKAAGPLPAATACEYVRQAALGLQHAFERGMVHRDIKPANLLLTADGKQIKVLDMGLARLDRPCSEAEASTLTQEGTVVGTPDYIAPEQAMEARTVDIRADLYSLGCTLYFLLTGRPPFVGGSVMEKLLRHRLEEPPPVEVLRPDVPAAVIGVVRRLMAKGPAGRYRTPAEAAAALAAARGDDLEGCDTVTLKGAAARPGTTGAERLPRTLAAGFLALAGLLALSLLWPNGAGDPAGGVPAPPPEPAKEAGDAWAERVAALPGDGQAAAVAARLRELNADFRGEVKPRIEGGVVTGLEFPGDDVTDLSPLRALSALRVLRCGGCQKKGRLADLSPLAGMGLKVLDCQNTRVSDLSPLRGMGLTTLHCAATPVADLSPLSGMPLNHLDVWGTRVSDLSPLAGTGLTSLNCSGTGVSDLSPLRGMRLTSLGCNSTAVSDLSPLRGVRLRTLHCQKTRVTDLSPLRGMPLRELRCDLEPGRDAALLRSIETLARINDRPAAEWRAEWEDAPPWRGW